MPSLIEAIEIKRKTFFEFENAPYVCVDFEVSRPTARGGQTLVRLKMRNLLTRAVFDKTFKAGEKFAEPDLVQVSATFLYSDGEGFHLMDQESYETLTLSGDTVGDDRELLVDNLLVQILKYNGNPIAIQFPPHVELTVSQTEPGIRGDTAVWRRDQGSHARDRPSDSRAALHQGRREGEGPQRDARVRRPRLTRGTSLPQPSSQDMFRGRKAA